MKNDKPTSVKKWRGRIDAARQARKKLEPVWKQNVAMRRMRPFDTESDVDRAVTPDDWTRSRAKIAALFSQMPEVQLVPTHPHFAPAVPTFQKELNWVLKHEAKADVAMDEALADIVNAAGIGGILTKYEATFEEREVPVDLSLFPPYIGQMLLQTGEAPTQTVTVPVSERFVWQRISPMNLLWDAGFKGSDFNDALWVGYEGALPWSVAKREFDLKDSDKEDICKADTSESLVDEDDENGTEPLVKFTEVFYFAHNFDPKEKHFERLHRLVIVEGLDKPAVDEPYKGQEIDEETGEYVGVCIYPLQIASITYVSDVAVPPSDSEAGRPATFERMRSRSQIIQQREFSKPMRWANTNMVDPVVLDLINKGEWQGIIPVAGDGSRMLGEIARASYPSEDYTFDTINSRDLDDAWSLSQNQLGNFASGERSASEAKIVANADASRIGYERGKVMRFFLRNVEVLAGLLQLFYEAPHFWTPAAPEGQQPEVSPADAAWDRKKIAGKFVFTARQDSSVLLDSQQRIQRLERFVNLAGQSGFVNIEPIVSEWAALSGLDPSLVMKQPNPPQPDSPNLSFRKLEDLLHPVSIAMLIKSGQAPNEDEMQAAKLLLADSMSPPKQVAPQEGPAGPPEPNPEWGPMPRITKRIDESGG